MTKEIVFDFETRSMCDLKKSGAYKYSLDPTTQPTCLAFKETEGKVWLMKFETINKPWIDIAEGFRSMWSGAVNEGYLFIAHNAFFETCIYKNILVKRYGWPDIPFRQFRCSAALAAACALPRNLAGAGEALGLAVQKYGPGYSAMMATCKPTKTWVAWKKLQDKITNGGRLTPRQLIASKKAQPPIFLTPEAAPDVWATLYKYCKIDVETEALLYSGLPPLTKAEQEIWFLNQQINWRGLRVDFLTIKKTVQFMAIEAAKLNEELDCLTMGLVASAGALKSILEFLAMYDVHLPNLRAKTIDDVLANREGLDSDARRLLEIRKALSKASTKKYQAFLDRINEDDRVRDITLYHGASTGRDTGTGVQPHNFPRGLIPVDKDYPYEAVNNVIECQKDVLHLLYGENLSVLFSSILRNMIIPSDDMELYVADFSKIEVAVLWWIADNKPGLKILNDGLDPYKYMAAANTGKRYEDIPDEGDARQLGKAQVLGCGFGMGASKFKTTAYDQYRLDLTDEQAKDAVKNYREQNASVPELWTALEQAAIRAIEENVAVTVGKCKFYCKDKFLWIKLPSGRRLAYREPQITMRIREIEYDDYHPETGEKIRLKRLSRPQKTVEFWAVNSKTKKWNVERTWGGTLTENVVQAIARDLMMRAIVLLERAGYRALLTVHDEAITERDIGEGDLKEFRDIMCSRPKWADEFLPLDAKAWKGPRYRK